jgi:dihydrodipicolinate synthase/N-acetylneuraminate lyase
MEDLASRLSGVLCATITPFAGPDQAVDYRGIAANAEWLRERNVRVLVVNGSIGEASSMTDDERLRAIGATASSAPEGALLVAGCSAADAAHVLRLSREAVEAGADAVLIQPPYHFPLSQEECVDFFTWLDREIACPFVLYDNPQTSRTQLELDTIDRISQLSHFLALKEANADLVRFQEIVDRFAGRFPVIAAAEDALLFMLVAGAHGCMTASAAFAPETLIELFEAVASSDLRRAQTASGRVRAFRELFIAKSRAGLPAYLPYTKAAVELVGGRAGPPRRPMRPITQAEREQLARVLVEKMGLALPAPTAAP